MSEPAEPKTTDETSGRDIALTVERADDGLRLDAFLARSLSLSRSQVRRLLGEGAVWLDGRLSGTSDKGTPLVPGGTVEVRGFVRPENARALAEADRPLALLARGEGWLAIDKPAGWPMHPLRPDERGTLLGSVIARHPELHGVGEGGLRSGVVHRLDVDTSGVVLIATEEAAWQRLRAAFREHRVAKRYRAIVRGELEASGEFQFGLEMARHSPARVRVVAEGAGADAWVARQRVRPVEVLRDATLVEVEPATGFLHQIRATLAHLGHPVVGDATYGDGPVVGVADRHLLHAAHVAIDEIDVESPDPPDFARALDVLRAG